MNIPQEEKMTFFCALATCYPGYLVSGFVILVYSYYWRFTIKEMRGNYRGGSEICEWKSLFHLEGALSIIA